MNISRRFKRKIADRWGYWPRSFSYHERGAKHRKIVSGSNSASGGIAFTIERTELPAWAFWGLWTVAIGLFYVLIWGGIS